MMTFKLGIIGGGVMAEALLSRLIEQQIYSPEEILVSEPQSQKRASLTTKYNIKVTENNKEVTSSCSVLLLAIKPQILQEVIAELGRLPEHLLIISILAGITLERLENSFVGLPVIRSMPNTPATVGAGVSAISPGGKATYEHLEVAKTIFKAVGEVVEVPEYLMDAVTGLSGSGPAYVAIVIEALADGGVAAGLPRAIAQELALMTVLGTAVLVQQSKIHPGELKDRVTSPGGTTIAGVVELEKNGLRSALIQAVLAASRRSKELGA